MIIDGKNYSFTQPVCTECWMRENASETSEGGLEIRIPSRLKTDEREFVDLLEVCCKCGRATVSQIFIRIDPSTVEFASPEDD